MSCSRLWLVRVSNRRRGRMDRYSFRGECGVLAYWDTKKLSVIRRYFDNFIFSLLFTLFLYLFPVGF